MTNSQGVVAAVIAAAAIITIFGAASGWVADHRDSGPTGKDIKTSFDLLKDGRPTRAQSDFLLPFGTPLPLPEGGGYCGDAQDALAERGKLVGALPRFTIQNVYSGKHPADIQVTGIRVQVIESLPPAPGAVVLCVNSGGDQPIYAYVQAENGRLLKGQRNDKENKEATGADIVSFVLKHDEQQQVNLIIFPGSRDQRINLIADAVSEGRKFSVKINPAPFLVVTDSAASPFKIYPKPLGRGDGDPTVAQYACTRNMDLLSTMCGENRVFTREEERVGDERADTPILEEPGYPDDAVSQPDYPGE